MSNIARMMQRATAGAGGAGLDIDEVFSTYLYTGTGSAHTIQNGIDLTEGGLVWTKSRGAHNHSLHDSARGVTCLLKSNATNAQYCDSTQISAFTSNGFTVGTDGSSNTSGRDYASWTWRKAPKFFDVVTYTGDGTNYRNISHNLGTTVGHVIVKKVSGGSAAGWINWHRTFSDYQSVFLNTTEAVYSGGSNGGVFGQTSGFTSTQFQLGGPDNITYHNENGSSYVAYLFAHNDGDGEFGPDADQDVIKCGSYAGQSSGGTDIDVNLGFEPQWLLLKPNASASWYILDNMRGIATGGNSERLFPNNTNAESSTTGVALTPTGFTVTAGSELAYASGYDIIYMAIRRGPLAEPTSATDVFGSLAYTGNGASTREFTVGSAVSDMLLQMCRSSSSYNYPNIGSRLTGKGINTSSSASEIILAYDFDKMDGVHETGFENTLNQSSETYIMHSWKRAPSYFDVVAYTGTGSARTVSHNLGVAPEMMWVKPRETGLASSDWWVFHKDLSTPADDSLVLNSNGAENTGNGALLWNSTMPTNSVFSLGTYNGINQSGRDFIAYLFATVAGVSKVGSYTGTGGTNTQVIDCGFSAGARFVLLKRYNASGYDWQVFDTERGITSGNDAKLALNTTAAESTINWGINPNSSGFEVTGNGLNESGGEWIFYAIA